MWIWGMKTWSLFDIGQHAGNIFVWHILTKIKLGIWMIINNIALALKYCMWDSESLYKLVTKKEELNGGIVNNISSISEVVFELLKNNDLIQAVIYVATTISVVAVVVKYGYVIFKTYFLNVGNEISLSPIDAFKRLLITLLVALLFPMITLNMFYGATIIGGIIGNQIYEASISNGDVLDNENISNDLQLKYYVFSKKYGISPSTYCNDFNYNERETSEKVTTSEGPYGAEYSEEKMNNDNTYSLALVPLDENNPDVEVMWNAFCEKKLTNPYNLNVKEYESDQKVYHFSEPSTWGESEIYKWKNNYPALVGQTLIDKVNPRDWLLTADGQLNMINIVVLLLQIVFSCWLFMNTAKHIANLLATILMSWYYIQGYFEPQNNGILGYLFKKIFSASMTQIFTMIMFGFYLGYFVNNPQITFTNTIISFVLIMAIVGGTQTVSEVIDMSDLNRANVGSAVGKGLTAMLK